MFKDKYIDSLNSISPDGYIKQKVLSSIDTESQKPKNTNNAFIITAVAVALSLTIAISGVAVGIIIKNPFEDTVVSSEVNIEEDEEIITSIDNDSSKVDINDTASDNKVSADFQSSSENYKPQTQNNFNDFSKIPDIIINSTENSNNDYSLSADGFGSSESHAYLSLRTFNNNSIDGIVSDNKYIYQIMTNHPFNYSYLRIFSIGKEPVLLSTTTVSALEYVAEEMLFIKDNKLFVVGRNKELYSNRETFITIYDVSNPKKPVKIMRFVQSGYFLNFYLENNTLYLRTSMHINKKEIDKNDPMTYVPHIIANNHNGVINDEEIVIPNNSNANIYFVIASYDIVSGNYIDCKAILYDDLSSFKNENQIVLFGNESKNVISFHIITLKNGNIEYSEKNKIAGENIIPIDFNLYNSKYNLITRSKVNGKTHYNIYKLDSSFNVLSSLKNLFSGIPIDRFGLVNDTAFFKSYADTNSLTCIDLSNSKNLKISNHTDLYTLSNYIFEISKNEYIFMTATSIPEDGPNVRLSVVNFDNPNNIVETTSVVLDKYYSSTAYLQPESVFIDKEKKVFGLLLAMGHGEYEYGFFRYENGKITLISTASNNVNYNTPQFRVLSTENYLYVFDDNNISVVDSISFKEISHKKY